MAVRNRIPTRRTVTSLTPQLHYKISQQTTSDCDSLLHRSAAIWRRTVSASVVKLLTTTTFDNAGALAMLFNSARLISSPMPIYSTPQSQALLKPVLVLELNPDLQSPRHTFAVANLTLLVTPIVVMIKTSRVHVGYSGVFRGRATVRCPPLAGPWKFFTGDFIWKGAFFLPFSSKNCKIQQCLMVFCFSKFQKNGRICGFHWTFRSKKCFSFRELRPPDPLPTRGSAPGPRWGLRPQTPVIGSRSVRSPCPPLPNPKYATA